MRTISLSIFIWFSISALAQVKQILPKDESNQDSELYDFVEALKEATYSRDTSFICSHIAAFTYIPIEGGERVGKERFIRYYFSGGESYNEDLWSSLEEVFAIGGGAFNEAGNNKEAYFMPYTSAAIYNDDYFTSLGVVLALSDEVYVYEKPNTKAKIIETLDHEIILSDETLLNSIPAWEAVRTKEGILGFVRSVDVVYTVSNRCGLIKENGLWKLEYSGSYH